MFQLILFLGGLWYVSTIIKEGVVREIIRNEKITDKIAKKVVRDAKIECNRQQNNVLLEYNNDWANSERYL